MHQDHVYPPLRRIRAPFLTAICLTIALSACGAHANHSVAETSATARPAASASIPIGSVSGAGQLQVAEQPWWQHSAATPRPTQTTVPRKTITVALPGDVLFEANSPGPDRGRDQPAGGAAGAVPLSGCALDPHRHRTHRPRPEQSGRERDKGQDPVPRPGILSQGLARLPRHAERRDHHRQGLVTPSRSTPATSPAHMAANRRCDFTITTTAA